MRSLEARLQRLEQAATRRSPFRDDPELSADFDCMGIFELKRASAALTAAMNGDTERAAEARRLLALARARRLHGWTQADKAALRKQERDKERTMWGFTRALQRRHERFYPDNRRFDVLDLTEPEIKLLAEVAEKATCANDLDAVAEVASRLRLDGKVMDVATFAALVLRGEIAAQPPKPDG